MKADWQPTLTGARLLLRPLRPDDFEPLFAAASDPLVWEQHPDKTRSTRAGFERFFRGGLESKGALAVAEKAGGGLVGSSRFADHRPAARTVEKLGAVLVPDAEARPLVYDKRGSVVYRLAKPA